MDERALLINFLVCKIGVALAAITLIGAVLAMSSSFERTVKRDELKTVADTLVQAVRAIDSLPGEVWIARELPTVEQQFWIDIVGTYDNIQIVRMTIVGKSRTERVAILRNKLNGGEFELSCDSPTFIRLAKVGEIHLELV